MSLAALAIVSRRSGKSLYMRSFVESAELLFGTYGQNNNDADFFGEVLIEEETQKQRDEWPCEMKYQFMLHSALDRLDEILAEGKWKKPGATGADACWIGLLCSIGSFNAYAYLTTNAKYVTIIEDGIASDNVQLQKSRDNELKIMIAYIHRLYTETLLNPFSNLNEKITSEKFNQSVQSVVAGFNQR